MKPAHIVVGAIVGGALLAAAALVLRSWFPPSAGMPQPSAIDIGFAQSMALHHQQAIGMAQMLLDGRPTSLARLAQSIAYTQLLELGQMRGWLELWQQPLLPDKPGMDWMLLADAPLDPALTQYLLDCRNAPAGMVGLATEAELAELRRLEGQARDALFLRLMRAHHEGGLPMAMFAAQHARVPAVRALANRVVIEQSHELRLIASMLAALEAPRAD